MLRIVLFTLSLLLTLVVVSAISKTSGKATSAQSIISCYPYSITPYTTNIFNLPTNPDSRSPEPRKDVFTLTPDEIDSLRMAFHRMMIANNSGNANVKSWVYQTSIHGTSSTTTKPVWKTSKYAHNALSSAGYEYFLTWHRMYLYFFERILLSYQGNPNLRLPYWDPQSTQGPGLGQFPQAYLDKTWDSCYYKNGVRYCKKFNNPLRVSQRSSSPGLKRTQNPNDYDEYDTYSSDLNKAESEQEYCYFLLRLSSSLHSRIHGFIGGTNGYMTNLITSAKDPAFFLLHVNIDRIWDKWVMNGGKNPTNGNFDNKYFYFFDELRHMYKIKGTEVTNTKNKLKYTYPGIIISTPSTGLINDCCGTSSASSKLLMKAQSPATFQSNITTLPFSGLSVINMSELLKTFSAITNNQTLILELEDVTIQKFPEGVIDVFLVKKTVAPQSITITDYCSSLPLANITMKHSPGDKSNLQINITDIYKKLKPATISQLYNLKLVLVNSRPEAGSNFSISFKAINLLLQTQ